jgi:hypothetical protein
MGELLVGSVYTSEGLRFGFGKPSVPVVAAETRRCPSLEAERKGDREGDHPTTVNGYLGDPVLLECGCGRLYALATPVPAAPVAPAPTPENGGAPATTRTRRRKPAPAEAPAA